MANDYALDTDVAHLPVVIGKHYTLSFDLELDGTTGGTELFHASIAEFDAAGGYLGEGVGYNPTLPTDQTFHHYSVGYVPQHGTTAKIVIGFRPINPGFVSALVLDNVVLASIPQTNVTWGTPVNISGDSDVSTSGTLDRAYNFGNGPAATVNGVTFAAFAAGGVTATVGQTTLQALGDLSQGGLNACGCFASGVAPYAGLSAGYQELLGGGVFDWDNINHSYTLALDGLTTGKTYQIQIWSSDSSVYGAGSRNTTVIDGTGANSVTLSEGTGTDGSLGQYVIGTFTANSSEQVLTFNYASWAMDLMSAFQLRVLPSYATTPTNIVFSVSGGNPLHLTWPASHLGWIAQSNSVNLASAGSWFDIAGSASVTSLSIPINPTTPKVFYRLRLP